MLKNLKIKNYAIISEIDIDFGDGFNVITGETGAGKSILMGGLGLILGKRVDTSVLNNQSSKCIIEGNFKINKEKLISFFNHYELDYDDNSILRREILPSGKSRAFINDTPVNLNILKELSEQLIDIHSQHQTIQLNKPAFQLSILDGLAGNQNTLALYKDKFALYSRLKHELKSLQEKEFQAKKDHDYYSFQLNEIEELRIQENEEKDLEKEIMLLSNAEKIKSNLDQFVFLADQTENNIKDQILSLQKLLKEVAEFNSIIGQSAERIDSLLLEFKDIEQELVNFSNSVEVDNKRLDEVSERIDKFNHLLSKHQLQNSTELLQYKEDLQEKVDGLTSLETQILRLTSQISTVEKDITNLAFKLTSNRKSITKEAKIKIEGLLYNLGMQNADIEFNVTALENYTETGILQLEILFSTNPGSQPQPIQKVASGGELSRLMLCLKYLLADSYQTPSIIFDEIDMGISGEIAIKVGEMMSLLSKNHQLISITHLPQVAAMGKEHLYVYKESDDSKTETKIKVLDSSEKITQIAKMIGGDHPSETAILSSKELVKKFS